VTLVVVAGAIVFVALTNMRPAYDAYGWLVWGRQALHGNLNTNGAPSWKPLTFLFTYPYALAGSGQMWLWMVTAVAAAFAGPMFAARIAYRLTGPSPERHYAPFVAAAFAAIAVLGLDGYWQLIVISNSDPMIVTLCLAAIDAHLSGRRGLAFAALVLASLGRPEAWPFAGIYAIWAWRALPRMRPFVAAGVAAIPLLWFGIPALTAKSWFIAGDVALNPHDVIHGNKLISVAKLFLGLYSVPIQVAVLLALVLAVARRDRTALLLAGAALAWVAIETAFIFHRWPADARYLTEPAAVLVVLAAAAVGRLLAVPRDAPLPLRLASVGAVAILVAVLVPTAQDRVQNAQAAIVQRGQDATQMNRLQAVIARLGGASRIRSCGQPTTLVGLESALAYQLGMNVGYVGHRPGKLIRLGEPIVLFKPYGLGWRVTPIHILRANETRCASLAVQTSSGPASAGLRLLRVGPRIVAACPHLTTADRRSHRRVSSHSRRRSASSRPRAGARWRSGFSRLVSWAISRRTRSTTSRRRTSRTWRRGSSGSASGCATRSSSRRRAGRRTRSDSAARPRSKTRTRARCRPGRSSGRRRRIDHRASCRLSRRSRRRF
jgi:hypothetical protein